MLFSNLLNSYYYFPPTFLLSYPFIGYLMCIFEEKLDEDTLMKIQDFEFAVSTK